MPTFGEVEDVLIKKIEWRIDNFLSLPVDGTYCDSPKFTFASETWYLTIVPNGKSDDDSVGHIGLYLCRGESGPPIHLAFSLSFKTLDGKTDGEVQVSLMFEKGELWGRRWFMPRSTLLEKKAQLLPSDTLTVICRIENDSKLPKDMANEKLIDDMRNIFHSDEYSDVIIKVKNEEFRLHRIILAGRSPYFRSLFQSKENTTGIVTIDDCEADIFRKYTRFIYTGKVDEMTEKNVCDLFKVADKYKEEQLKVECLCFMKRKMSVENFCDFTALALKHDEKDLLQCATDLFCKHSKEIITSVKWQTLLRDYPAQANDLYIKVHGDKCK